MNGEGRAFGQPIGYVQAYGGAGGTAESVKTNTQLENHLQELRNLYNEITNSVSKAGKMADRLIGIGPEPACPPNESNLKEASDPPLLVKMERQIGACADLIKVLHHHLARLERI